MNNDLISVIVPIYKVEKYLHRCVDSIINQNYKNLEIILVDDGSPDNCPIICDEYAKKDSRIKVIHKENGGLSDARNKGIDIAKGEYYSFIDSDDCIAPNFIEELYEICINYDCEISICRYLDFSEDSQLQLQSNYSSKENILTYSSREINIELFGEFSIEANIAWNKLYSKKCFDNIRYPYGRIHEDTFTTYKLFYTSKKIGFTQNKLYYYRYNPNSIIHVKFNINRLDGLMAFQERLNFYFSINDMELYDMQLIIYLNSLPWNYLNVLIYIKNNKNILLDLKNKFLEIYNIALDRNVISKNKFFYIFFSKCPTIASIFLLIKKILVWALKKQKSRR